MVTVWPHVTADKTLKNWKLRACEVHAVGLRKPGMWEVITPASPNTWECVSQLAERRRKAEVGGSIPSTFLRCLTCPFSSVWLERRSDKAEAPGSNPGSGTRIPKRKASQGVSQSGTM